MKILYIDPICPQGHINFNNIHINALLRLSDNVDLVFEEGYYNQLNVNNCRLIYQYPKLKNHNNGISNRIKIYRNLKTILKNVPFSEYDKILFSSFDEISFTFFNLPSNVCLINHTNVSGVYSSKIKRCLYKRLSNKHQQIVLDSLSKKYLIDIGINNVKCVNHGLPPKIKVSNDWRLTHFVGESVYNHIIFSPSRGSNDYDFLNQLIEDKGFVSLLKSTNSLLIMHDDEKLDISHKYNPNILLIKKRLSQTDYENLFLQSSLILITYPDSFRYRSSGVFMEALANNKDLIVPEIPSFSLYKSILDESNFFTSVNDAIFKIENRLNHYFNIRDYDVSKIEEPDYSFLSLE